MKKSLLFPDVSIDKSFKEKLRLEVVKEFNSQARHSFSWKWLFTPGIALTALLIIFINQNKQIFPYNNQNQTQTTIFEESEHNQLAENIAKYDDLDQELVEINTLLNNDSDISYAIEFTNL